MEIKEIEKKVKAINALVNTDEKPFILFIELYDYCKKNDKLLELSAQYINFRIIDGMKNVDIQFKALHKLLELYHYTDNQYNYHITLWRVGILYSKFGHPLKAMTKLKEAENYFREIHDIDKLFLCTLNIGVLHYRIRNWKKAEKYYLKCELLLKNQKKENKITDQEAYDLNVYFSQFNLTLIYTELEAFNLELKYSIKALETAKIIGNSDKIFKATLNLISSKINNGNLEDADKITKEMLSYKDIENDYNYYPLLNTIFKLEHVQGHFKKALKVLRKSCVYAKKYLTSTNLNYQEIIDTGLSLSYEHGTKEDIIYFSKELQTIKNTQNEETLSISKISLKQFEDISDLELEKKYTDEITYILGHDLKAPIRIVKNIAEILEQKPEEAKELLPLIITNSSYALELMNATLNYSEIASNLDAFSKISLANVANHVIKNLKTEIDSKNVKISHENLPIIEGNFAFLKQLFTNLISNAIKYGGKNNVITISSINKDNQFHLIEIKDEGIGIPKNELKTIFKLFKKSSLNEDNRSTGVGLAICKRIVDVHKGAIYASSEEAKGSSFFIQLPV